MVTRPTGDVGLAVAGLRIDVAHHLEHHASLQLLRFGIVREVVEVVAVGASLSERESNVRHRDSDVLRGEHFEILGARDSSGCRAACALLGVQRVWGTMSMTGAKIAVAATVEKRFRNVRMGFILLRTNLSGYSGSLRLG